LELLDRLRLQPVSLFAKQCAVRGPGPPTADREEDVVRIAQIGTGVFHSTSEILEYAALPLEYFAHGGIERQLAEIRAPGDPDAVEMTLQRLRERSGIRWITRRIP